MICKYIDLNNGYCLGEDFSTGLCGLYYNDSKEVILHPKYKSIKSILNLEKCFQVVDSEGNSFLYFHDPGSPYVEKDDGYYILINEVFDQLSASYDSNKGLIIIGGYIGHNKYCGLISYYEGIPSLLVPINYSRFVIGKDLIAAICDGDLFHCDWFFRGERIELKHGFALIEGISKGLNNPYPIIEGTINLIGDDLYCYPFEHVYSCGNNIPYYIVQKDGKIGLWHECFWYNAIESEKSTYGDLVLECLFDEIIPNLEYSPINKLEVDPSCSYFTLVKDAYYGVFDSHNKRVIIPTLVSEPPIVVTGVSYREDLYTFEPDVRLFTIGFICAKNNKYGVVNTKGVVIIPLSYDSIELITLSSKIVKRNSNRWDHYFFLARRGLYCSLFDRLGGLVIDELCKSISIIDSTYLFFICIDDNGFYKLYGNGWISGEKTCTEVVKGVFKRIEYDNNLQIFRLLSFDDEYQEFNPKDSIKK